MNKSYTLKIIYLSFEDKMVRISNQESVKQYYREDFREEPWSEISSENQSKIKTYLALNPRAYQEFI
jgi:hypothetical protein